MLLPYPYYFHLHIYHQNYNFVIIIYRNTIIIIYGNTIIHPYPPCPIYNRYLLQLSAFYLLKDLTTNKRAVRESYPSPKLVS